MWEAPRLLHTDQSSHVDDANSGLSPIPCCAPWRHQVRQLTFKKHSLQHWAITAQWQEQSRPHQHDGHTRTGVQTTHQNCRSPLTMPLKCCSWGPFVWYASPSSDITVCMQRSSYLRLRINAYIVIPYMHRSVLPVLRSTDPNSHWSV